MRLIPRFVNPASFLDSPSNRGPDAKQDRDHAPRSPPRDNARPGKHSRSRKSDSPIVFRIFILTYADTCRKTKSHFDDFFRITWLHRCGYANSEAIPRHHKPHNASHKSFMNALFLQIRHEGSVTMSFQTHIDLEYSFDGPAPPWRRGRPARPARRHFIPASRAEPAVKGRYFALVRQIRHARQTGLAPGRQLRLEALSARRHWHALLRAPNSPS